MKPHPKPAADVPKWSSLLVDAVNKPGLIMEAYSAFHNYSIGNQILAFVQCHGRGLEPGPINTFPGWQALGRIVKRGERALTLCMPVTRKVRDEDSQDGETDNRERTFTTFMHKPRWFVLSQTVGDEFIAPCLPEWNTQQALDALQIEQISFTDTDGNCQGYARLCCRQHKRAYVAKSVMWRSAFLASSLAGNQRNQMPHKFKTQRARRNVIGPLPSFLRLDRFGLLYFTSWQVPWLSLQIGFSVDVGGINRDVAQLGAHGIDIYSGTQKSVGVMWRLFRMRNSRQSFFDPFVGGRLRHSHDSGVTGTQRREDDKLYRTVLNHVDVVWKARLTLVAEYEINDRLKGRTLRLE